MAEEIDSKTKQPAQTCTCRYTNHRDGDRRTDRQAGQQADNWIKRWKDGQSHCETGRYEWVNEWRDGQIRDG
eukprot:scaffold125960_cov16-Prasinocladus_malaysianus.AAC.1